MGEGRAQFPSSARHFFVCRLVEVWCGRASSLRTMGKCKSMARRKNWRNSRSIPSLKVFTPPLSLSFSSYNLLPRAHFLVTDKKTLMYFVLRSCCVREGRASTSDPRGAIDLACHSASFFCCISDLPIFLFLPSSMDCRLRCPSAIEHIKGLGEKYRSVTLIVELSSSMARLSIWSRKMGSVYADPRSERRHFGRSVTEMLLSRKGGSCRCD